ncbi:ATP-dependent rRNA helicase spb4 [Venturia nashicola]|uniref:RNA helicase n=1 Tax=Venturia nashicola TaxID=86259 RepID=A0A4Z1NRN1_9PEZI|nr:ATP-dependent rRNA helicase spb4 [Venturia nashicola]
MAPVEHRQVTRAWDQFDPPLSDWLLEAIASNGYEKATPVQANVVPLFAKNKDVVVEAVTGSGKTLAFLLPIVEKLLKLQDPIKKHHVGAIIISPTRELAQQIHTVLISLLKFHPASADAMKPPDEVTDSSVKPKHSKVLKIVPQLLFGGTRTPAQDLSAFLKQSPNILIATPGRLVELLRSPHVHCSLSFEVLVLDEADRLLDLGFKDDLGNILHRLPKQRRTGLFSASMSEAVEQLVRVGLRNPVRINVKVKGDQKTPVSLQMTYMLTPPTHKLPALSALLKSFVPQKCIVFVTTGAAVDYLQHILRLLLPGHSVVPLSGKHEQHVRAKNYEKFADSTVPSVLLTTEVAARGLDIASVDLIVQLDPPTDPKNFLHRCGRAGRAGRKGLAVIMLTPGREEDYIEFLRVRRTPVLRLTEPEITISDEEAQDTTNRIRELVLQDRALHVLAQRALPSWVRAYSKHVASSIFRVADLQWDQLGHAWGLLKLPSMPELKKWEGDRKLGLKIDFENYRYKDKQREKHRIEEDIKKATEEPVVKKAYKKEKGNAWSQKLDQKEVREERREKRASRRDAEKRKKMTPEELEAQERLDSDIAAVRKSVAQVEEEFTGFDD